MKVMIRNDQLAKHYGKSCEIKTVDALDLEVYERETFS